MNTILFLGSSFLAGIFSFFSPCILPLIPSYLTYITGVSLDELKNDKKQKAFIHTMFFVLGFSIVFVFVGAFFSTTFGLFGKVSSVIYTIAGIIVIFLGLNFIFNFWKLLNIEKRFHLKNKPVNLLGSFLFGMAFGAGWTPCVGPFYGSIVLLAGSSNTFWLGIVSMFIFSLDIGFPFIISSLFFNSALKQFNKIKPHMQKIKILSGIFLILIGLLILFGQLKEINSLIFKIAGTLSIIEYKQPGIIGLIFGLCFILLSAILIFFYIRKLLSVLKVKDNNAKIILPYRIIFISLFLIIGILILTGILNISALLIKWFTFQGY